MESTCGLMARCMLESGQQTRSKEPASTLARMGDALQVRGMDLSCMALADRHGQMDVATRDSMLKIRRMASAFSHGPMAVNMKDIGVAAVSMATAGSAWRMVLHAMQNGPME